MIHSCHSSESPPPMVALMATTATTMTAMLPVEFEVGNRFDVERLHYLQLQLQIRRTRPLERSTLRFFFSVVVTEIPSGVCFFRRKVRTRAASAEYLVSLFERCPWEASLHAQKGQLLFACLRNAFCRFDLAFSRCREPWLRQSTAICDDSCLL